MRTAVAHLESISPYSQTRCYSQEVEKLDKEGADDYERRTWINKTHVNENGNIYIPPMALKNCMAKVARYLGMKIPGRRSSTYTKHFEAGVLVMDPVVLPITREDVDGQWIFVPADGVRGSGKRVWKCFPVIKEWKGTAKFYILDDTITKEVFETHLREAGNFIGLGYFRPENNGYWGRFKVTKIEWE